MRAELGYKMTIPSSVRRIVDRYVKTKQFKFKKYFEEYHEILNYLHNRFEGKRVFIVGTAPSLNKTDLKLLDGEYVWGVNTLFNAVDRIKHMPIFWGVCDKYVFKQYHKQLLSLNNILFLVGDAGIEYLINKDKYVQYNKNDFSPILVWINGRMSYWNRYGFDLTDGVWGGRTVMIDAGIQPAFYLGFKEIYLLGCDCDYSKGHHFDGGKHAHVDKMEGGKPMSKDVDRERVMASYRVCRKAIEGSGGKIVNCTVGGKLEVFERQKLEDVINNV